MKLNIFIIFIILWNMDIAMAASWYNSSWLSRQKITIDSSVTTEDLTDFPYMIKLTDSANPVFDEAQSDGDDILFTSVNGTTKLSHEIEKFVSTDGSEEFIIWVKLPTLLSLTNTVIYMYYGNSSAANQEDIANVWDGDYVGVWHLNETSGSHADSTLNSNNSTSIVVAQQGTATGQIDGADEFDGNNDYIETADSVSLSVTGNMTIEAWINPTSYASYRGIVGKTLTTKPAPYDFYLVITTGKPILYRGNGSVFSSVQATNPPGTGAFHYVAVTMSDTTVTHYLDGGTNGSGTLSTTISDGGGTLLIGNRADLGTDMYGYLDEIRISKIARGSAWLTACKNNQGSPADYQSESGQQDKTRIRNTAVRHLVIR